MKVGVPRIAGMIGARIAGIRTHLPAEVLDNEMLSACFPDWSADKIFDKLGIRERRIATADETAADLAYAAASRLFADGVGAADDVDFLIFCTQAPDYILPTSACILQSRLGLKRDIGALDINLGCSGYVYGLSIAAGLIASSAARNVLLLTADTYSKFIHKGDRSVRTLFGDGAAATLVSADDASDAALGPFVFGTDGAGARSLIVETGGARTARSAVSAVDVRDQAGNTRSGDNLYMNGAGVMSFSLREVPKVIDDLLSKSGLARDDVEFYVLHQANKFMLDALQRALKLDVKRMPRFYELVGNTVSSSIPFCLEDMVESFRLKRGDRIMLVGFGVGLSWASGLLTW